jgi:hypothetical protein
MYSQKTLEQELFKEDYSMPSLPRNQKMRQSKFMFCLIIAALALITASCSFFGSSPTTSTTPTPSGSPASMSASGMLHAQGDHLVDSSGKTVVLRGAEVDSAFIYIKNWVKGKLPNTLPVSQIFSTMAHSWHMNATRIPISPWIYQKDPSTYMSQLDQWVQTATSDGLYVILVMHDDAKAGSPYGNNATLPKEQDIPFWKAIASHYKNNPMVMYDVYNEPKDTSWTQWLHGGGTVDGAQVVGFQDLVSAIRSVGAQQLIVVEPGSSGGKTASSSDPNAAAEEGGWSNFPGSDAINDPNIMYSLHVYQYVSQPASVQNVKWGPILHHYPIFYGEWAFLANGYGVPGKAHCQNLPTNSSGATQVVNNFLNYMASVGASWTAWQFAPKVLVQNYKSFVPTTFPSSFGCGNSNADLGMGSVIQQYLSKNNA